MLGDTCARISLPAVPANSSGTTPGSDVTVDGLDAGEVDKFFRFDADTGLDVAVGRTNAACRFHGHDSYLLIYLECTRLLYVCQWLEGRI